MHTHVPYIHANTHPMFITTGRETIITMFTSIPSYALTNIMAMNIQQGLEQYYEVSTEVHLPKCDIPILGGVLVLYIGRR